MFVSAGLASILAAVVGGGLRAFGVEVPVLASWKRQLLLAVLGGLLLVSGLKKVDQEEGAKKVEPAITENKNFERNISLDSGMNDTFLGVSLAFNNIRISKGNDVASVTITEPKGDKRLEFLKTGDSIDFNVLGCKSVTMFIMKIVPDSDDRSKSEEMLKADTGAIYLGSGKLALKFIGSCFPNMLPAAV